MKTYIEDFLPLVARMRAAQKYYFEKRTQGSLIAAKELEYKVDRALAGGIVLRVDHNQQPVLFKAEDLH